MSAELVIALDVPSLADAAAIVSAVGEEASIYKIGHELFTAEGPRAVDYLRQREKSVFLDLKLHEIPNSVAAAVRSAGELEVAMVSVHATGGPRMLTAAVEAASGYDGLDVVALTIVTGLDDADLAEIGFAYGTDAMVQRLADTALSCGCRGVVASAYEVGALRERVSADALIVVPGVRLPVDPAADQRRVGSPSQASGDGASHVVVGRGITRADDPGRAAHDYNRQLRPR